MDKEKKALTGATIIVTILVALIILLMETTGLGASTPADPPPTDGMTTTTQGDGTIGDATSATKPMQWQSYAFSTDDIATGSLIFVESGSTSHEKNQAFENLYDMRKNPDGSTLFRVQGDAATKMIHGDVAKAFVALVKGYQSSTVEPVTLVVSKAFAYDNRIGDYRTALAIGVGVLENTVPYGLRSAVFADRTEWLFENMHKYGFLYVPETETSGHLRYVGVPHATYIHTTPAVSGLEAYLNVVRRYTSHLEPLEIEAEGETYCVYYAQKDGNTVSATVPQGTVGTDWFYSGDNQNGIVICYRKPSA